MVDGIRVLRGLARRCDPRTGGAQTTRRSSTRCGPSRCEVACSRCQRSGCRRGVRRYLAHRRDRVVERRQVHSHRAQHHDHCDPGPPVLVESRRSRVFAFVMAFVMALAQASFLRPATPGAACGVTSSTLRAHEARTLSPNCRAAPSDPEQSDDALAGHAW
jgi:hypothetical protein